MPKGYVLIRIARKTGVMKTEDTKKSNSTKKKKKDRASENRKDESGAFKKIEKQNNEKIRNKYIIQNKNIKVNMDEVDDDYWLDE